MNTPGGAAQPIIARIWRGSTTVARADENARCLHEIGFEPLIEKALGAQMFREDREGEMESVEAMSRFAGDDPQRIHHLPRDAEFLIEMPEGVQVLDIVARERNTGSPPA